MRIERELMRGAGPVAVLKLLEDGAKYGYELVTALAEHAEGVLDMGQSTLYPMLYNLEAQGYIKASWEEGDTGRQRKYYSLTADGKRRLADGIEQWRALAQAFVGLGILPSTGSKKSSRPALGGASS
jgi:PadR family transcriptional regulator, regulatory protein PadR